MPNYRTENAKNLLRSFTAVRVINNKWIVNAVLSIINGLIFDYLFIMASSSLKYNLFASFYGQGLRQTFLSHLCRHLNENGITVFTNQDLVRGEPVLPSLVQRIRESRISIVVLSQKYASSSWCLNELVEILRCRETMGHIVMTIFYRVDPSHVRNQTGDFGNIFVQTCAGKTEEERRMWSQALTDVGNIAGEDSRNWFVFSLASFFWLFLKSDLEKFINESTKSFLFY